MTRKLLILGAGGHGQVLADILLCASFNNPHTIPIGYVDDVEVIRGQSRLGLPVLGKLSDLEIIEHDEIITGIGNNVIRSELFRMMQARQEVFAKAIHPNAVIPAGVNICEGTVICAGVIVNIGSTIGANVILNTACSVDHHNQIKDHAHIAPRAHLEGDVIIGEGVFVGIGATILPQCSAGNGVL